MAAPRRRAQGERMKKIAVPLTILVLFTAVSLWLVAGEHPFGYLMMARDQPWGAQVLLDLVIACSLFLGWMRRDARARGLPVVPYFVATLFLGSIGALAYLVHRGLRAQKETAGPPEAPAVKMRTVGA
jgi:hypothetical protein